MQHWEQVAPSGPDCPMVKSVHAAAYFTLSEEGKQSHHLMILGGRPVGDAWICDVKNWLWKKVISIILFISVNLVLDCAQIPNFFQ